jgi:hypothetical protein
VPTVFCGQPAWVVGLHVAAVCLLPFVYCLHGPTPRIGSSLNSLSSLMHGTRCLCSLAAASRFGSLAAFRRPLPFARLLGRKSLNLRVSEPSAQEPCCVSSLPRRLPWSFRAPLSSLNGIVASCGKSHGGVWCQSDNSGGLKNTRPLAPAKTNQGSRCDATEVNRRLRGITSEKGGLQAARVHQCRSLWRRHYRVRGNDHRSICPATLPTWLPCCACLWRLLGQTKRREHQEPS